MRRGLKVVCIALAVLQKTSANAGVWSVAVVRCGVVCWSRTNASAGLSSKGPQKLLDLSGVFASSLRGGGEKV